jgi:hypothetical protein
MTRNLTRPPRPATIDALAKGLEVPVSAVRTAAAACTGLHYYDDVPGGQEQRGDQERELLIASIDELTADSKEPAVRITRAGSARGDRSPHARRPRYRK